MSVTNLGYIWVYLDPFVPKSVESGEQFQTALDQHGENIILVLYPLVVATKTHYTGVK